MMSNYPEHEKMQKARSQGSEEIGLFLEWLRSSETHYVIAQWETKRACEAESWNVSQGQPLWRCVEGRIMRGPDFEEDIDECDACEGTGYFKPEHPDLIPASVSILDLLSKYFSIDQDVIEEEKRAMLNEIQAKNIEEGDRET